MRAVELFCRGDDCIGEGPLWSVAAQALYWIDIGRKRLHRQTLSGNRLPSWSLPDHPGCIAELPANKLAVALGVGVHRLDLESGDIDLFSPVPARRPGTRFNDGKVDPKGRLWVGTMQDNFGPNGTEISIDRFDGALYRFDSDARVKSLEEDIGIPNTLAWSPDLKRFYFGDSLKGSIFQYDFDAESGDLSNQRLFCDVSGHGVPDGSAMDVDGCLWNARWDGSAVVKITPAGKVDQVIQLPVPRPTSCAFGGSGLKTLFVTSATNGLTAEQLHLAPLSGSVLAIEGIAQGISVPLMKLIRGI
jgi:sugar lactone lactonase YvrE